MSSMIFALGGWVVMIALVYGWVAVRNTALLSNTTSGRVVYHALGRGALGLFLTVALVAGLRSGDMWGTLVDVAKILLPLFLFDGC